MRPTKGKNLAIAEWPTLADGKEGWADYVLFAGLAGRRRRRGEAQAQGRDGRHPAGEALLARATSCKGDEVLPEGSPWGAHKVPFLFATNGRPFLRQLRTKSGIWFLDARRAENHPVPLEGWYTPEGLLDLLKQNVDEAHAKLKVEPMPYIDRDVPAERRSSPSRRASKTGKRELLVAMATGTGKTRTCIGLCYRLLKTKRFRRVLFLVDRNALGKQTADAFKDLRLENLQTFTDIFDVKELGDLKPERETKLQIATIQAMVKRVLGPHDDGAEADIPPVDQYDCIVVDECHRGYLLDRELSDREFLFRDEDDYISKYRRVLDHFDASKIGLTATPALHTKEIFGAPIFSYSLPRGRRRRVPRRPRAARPHRHQARAGRHPLRGARGGARPRPRDARRSRRRSSPTRSSSTSTPSTGASSPRTSTARSSASSSNHIDPEQDEKTLIFCATDEHADMVVRLLKEALKAKYGAVDDDAVAKITGATDKPARSHPPLPQRAPARTSPSRSTCSPRASTCRASRTSCSCGGCAAASSTSR